MTRFKVWVPFANKAQGPLFLQQIDNINDRPIASVLVRLCSLFDLETSRW